MRFVARAPKHGLFCFDSYCHDGIWYLQPSLNKVLKPNSPGAMDLARAFFMRERKDIMTNTQCGFIPMKLEIENRPDMQVFPNRVVYMSYKVDSENNLICSTSSYAPVLETLNQNSDCWEMRYDNELSNNCWLRIIYYPSRKFYMAEKYVKGELMVITSGYDWTVFFTHLTMVGLQNDEECLFLTSENTKTIKLSEHLNTSRKRI